MADTAINAGKRATLRHGGIFRVTDGATDYSVKLLDHAQIGITPGRDELVEYDDNGVLQTPGLGLPGYTEIRLAAHMVHAESPTGSLHNVLIAAGSAGLPKVFEKIELDIPDHARATTGERHSIANCWLTDYQYSAGEDFDTVTYVFRSTTSRPTVTAY